MKDKSAIFSVKSEKESLGFLLWQTTTLWQKYIKDCLKKEKITHPQFVVLASIAWFNIKKENCNQAKLSHHTKIDKATLGEIVKILIKNKLVKRSIDNQDARSYLLLLTDNGINIASRSVKNIEAVDKKFFSILKQKESSELIKILIKLTGLK